ncbi:MAG: ABC-three component system protein [Methyloceanibacter sp.]
MGPALGTPDDLIIRPVRRDELGDAATDKAKEQAARSVLAWAERASISIRSSVTEPFVCRGSLHMLADEMRIGWHPEFRDRLAHLLAGEEGAALSERAPVDIRTNTLKATREKVLKALQRFEAQPTGYSPLGVRIAHRPGPARSPHVEAEGAHGKGWFEVQDEGSQMAALLSGAGPRQQVMDFCAGAGGKTLALSSLMKNTGQLFAYDSDRMRLRPIFERLKRAGARNVQVLNAGETEALTPLEGKMDLVVIDAPCTGSGVWRRRPDAKWRLSPQMLEARAGEQVAVLDSGAALVKPGGRLAYITCSVLPIENRDQVDAFMSRHPDFKIVPWRMLWEAAFPVAPPASADGSEEALLMTPLGHGTDGFFVAVLERAR